MSPSPSVGVGERGAKWGAVFGFLTGIAATASIASFAFLPLSVPVDQVLANLGKYTIAILAAQIGLAAWGTFVVPFGIAIRNTLKASDPTFATGGAALLILGMSIFAVLADLQLGELSTLAKSYTAGGAGQVAAVVTGNAFLYGMGSALNVTNLLFSIGLILLGVGAINSGVFPNWVGFLGVIAGIVNLLASVPTLGFILTIVGVVLMIVWVFATSVCLLRVSGTRRAQPEPA